MAAEHVARPTPWGVVFSSLEERYAKLGELPADPAGFSRNPAVQRLLSDIESPDLVERAPVAAAEYQYLVFADVQHWQQGRPLHPVSRPAFEARLGPGRLAAPTPRLTYIQLPPRWIWAQPDPDGPHEPMDGVYAVPLAREELLLVAVLGLHADRAGLSQTTLTLNADAWERAPHELPDDPLAPAMPGGEVAGFRSVRTAAELVHLVRVALAVGAP